ncbi:hypothetical protein [Spiroplasma endosymbiont of Danaus chrysippus]|uniref:hypothetical protein n=1 Tax=Spiroplasma endosymbiont of Danaus chrysippus TaxID=2691041 RepID=UPI00157BA7BB|nr:hypothetical protein [Spiroplasma endosymbiont of Danaus chrysippus]
MKTFIKPILNHSKKGRKIIKKLNLKKENNHTTKVIYQKIENFLIKDNLNQETNENYIKLKLNNIFQHPKLGQKELKSITCKKINENDEIISNEIYINFEELNNYDYNIEIQKIENENIDEKIKKLNETKNKIENYIKSLIKTNNELINDINKNELEIKFEKNNYNYSNLTNISEWSANITNLAAGASGLIPGSGSIISPILTMTSASCSIFNSYIKDKKNNSIENIKTQINNIEITEQPSTSTGIYNSNFSTRL